VFTLTYVYADSTAVLGPLAAYVAPDCYDLCAMHAERLTAPRGWEVEGVEYFTTPPNLYDMPIRYGDLLTMPLVPHSYDCVTMWAVLEHVYRPREHVARVAELLKPGGRFIGLATNLNTLQARVLRRDDYPRHLTVFTRDSLRRVFEEHGLRVRRFWTDQKIFGGSLCGLLTFSVKRLLGCPAEELYRELKDPRRPLAFCCQWRGTPSFWIKQVNRVDKLLLTPVERLLDRFGLGYTLAWEAVYDSDAG
jgi:SAM-dependent methyltransferase